MTCKEKAADLYEMMSRGQVMEAFDKYYADDCTIVEKPTGEVRQGKEAQRKAIQEWFEMVKEHHGGSTGPITSDEDAKITMVQSSTDVTTEHGRMQMEEVAVQHWNNEGQIQKEEFYYQMGPPPQMG